MANISCIELYELYVNSHYKCIILLPIGDALPYDVGARRWNTPNIPAAIRHVYLHVMLFIMVHI